MSAEEAHVWRVDYTSSKMGMWIFLFTEIMLFGGMFVIYSVYRAVHPEEFHHAAQALDVLLGTFNTLILLTSSLTMALSIAFIRDEALLRWHDGGKPFDHVRRGFHN